jgi:SAM-dependent methyltransferase
MTNDERGRVASFYDEAASAWDAAHAERQNPLFRRRLHDSLRALLEPARGGALAVEIGAGTGPYIGTVAPMFGRLVCTDISAGMLEVLRARRDRLGLANVEVLRQDAAQLGDLADGSVDAVFSVGMFETLADPAPVFAAARRVLRKGGILAAITSNGSCPWYALRRHLEGGERPGHIVRYLTAGEVRTLAARAGFSVSMLDRWGALPPGIGHRALARTLDALGVLLHATFLARWLGLLAFRLVAK